MSLKKKSTISILQGTSVSSPFLSQVAASGSSTVTGNLVTYTAATPPSTEATPLPVETPPIAAQTAVTTQPNSAYTAEHATEVYKLVQENHHCLLLVCPSPTW